MPPSRDAARYPGLIDTYRDRLPLDPATEAVSLCEGNTPLVPLESIEREVGGGVRLYAKFEGQNPTGSFKDRGMTMAITRAREEGSRAVICASTGNTSASAAAYAARAGMMAFVLIPDGKIAMGKLAQAMMHGAVVIKIRGNFDAGMDLVKQMAVTAPVAVVNSINPYRLHGQKTVAFEVLEALGRAPDYHFLPVGNAGNISAHWLGYCESAPACDNYLPGAFLSDHPVREYAREILADARPVMVGYQAAGAAPFVSGAPIESPDTVATAIRIGNPQSWTYARSAVQESGGWFDAVDDDEILAIQRLLASREGIFCEPASAVSVAGAIREIRAGRVASGSTVVCTVTGHGLKDPDVAIRQSTCPIVTVEPEADAVRDAIMGHLG